MERTVPGSNLSVSPHSGKKLRSERNLASGLKITPVIGSALYAHPATE